MSQHNQHNKPISGSIGDSIPGIDAALLTGSQADRTEAARQIRAARLGTGFFCIDNLLNQSVRHRRLVTTMGEFFALSDNDPRKQLINVTGKENTHGWMPMFHEPAYQPGTIAHVESFDCGREPHNGENQSLASNRWPDIPGFRDCVVDVWDELTDIGMGVLKALAEALEMDPGFFVERCNSQVLSTMRLLNYPANDGGAEGDVGIAAHSDFECITLLSQTAPGLELMDINGDWLDAPASDDRLIVLTGDMLEHWTNGTFPATGHRVRCRNWQRSSIVLFFSVNDDVIIAPQSQFVSVTNPAKYAPIGQREHSRAQLRAAETNREEHASG